MGDLMQLDYGPKVRGVEIDDEHCSEHRHGALCRHDKHVNYAPDRLLREGSRVTVAVARDSRDEPWHVTELRCLHCPLSFDIHEVVGDWSVYEETDVILSEATLVPSEDGEGFVLAEPRILSAKVSLPGF
jgi:hypothetical protein